MIDIVEIAGRKMLVAYDDCIPLDEIKYIDLNRARCKKSCKALYEVNHHWSRCKDCIREYKVYIQGSPTNLATGNKLNYYISSESDCDADKLRKLLLGDKFEAYEKVRLHKNYKLEMELQSK